MWKWLRRLWKRPVLAKSCDLLIRETMKEAFPGIWNDYSLCGMDWVPDCSVADAMEVVTDLSPLVDISMEIRSWYTPVVSPGFVVKAESRRWVCAMKQGHREWAGEAETLPLAICRAALARYGAEVKLIAA